MTIHIEDLALDVIIGLLDFERDRPQRVIINATVSYEYNNDNFIDYADTILVIQEKLKLERYKLLESALIGLKEVLHTTYPNIQTLYIKISKPDILPQCSVGLSKTWSF